MRTLDRYISQKFLGTLLFTLIAFISIFVIVDLIDRLGDFLSHDVPKTVIFEYYIYYIPYILVLILPVAMLLSSLFSIGNLSRNNEIVAMKASGLSLQRILLPILTIGFLFSVALIYFGEKVVPLTNQKMYNISRVFLHKYTHMSQRRSNIYYKDNSNDNWIYIGYYDHRIQKGRNVSIQKIANQSIISRLDAKVMVWEDSSWVLENCYKRNSTNSKKFDVVKKYKLKNIAFTPDDIARVQKKHEEMTYKELKEFIEEVAQNGGEPKTWLVDLYLKISFPFSNFIIILFGAPLAAGHNRGGMAFGFGISLFVSFFFFGIIKTGQALGHSGVLHPFLAAWIGNLIFFIAGILILIKVRK